MDTFKIFVNLDDVIHHLKEKNNCRLRIYNNSGYDVVLDTVTSVDNDIVYEVLFVYDDFLECKTVKEYISCFTSSFLVDVKGSTYNIEVIIL